MCMLRSKNGASEGIRTLDSHLGKVVLYQLSYARAMNGRTIARTMRVLQVVFADGVRV
jgi:hypothetical protein